MKSAMILGAALIFASASAMSSDDYKDIPKKVTAKLQSCQELATDAVSSEECLDQSLKDYSLFQSAIETAIKYNLDIPMKNSITDRLKSDFVCDKNQSNSITNNDGSMWPREALKYCVFTKDLALKKWLNYYFIMKGSDHYKNVTTTPLD